MNLLTPLRLSVAELRHRPGRALLPGVALVVGFACLVASLLLTDAFRRAAVQGAPRVPDAVDLVVERARGRSRRTRWIWSRWPSVSRVSPGCSGWCRYSGWSWTCSSRTAGPD
ncbi:MAG TPA: hypothetical protein VIL00_10385 [Pseudonocardiaceae bacterium]